MHSNIVHVDSAAHAESVIKSLRSSSLSQRRYQRNAESSESIFTNLTSFDSVITAQLKDTTLKQRIDTKMAAVPANFQPSREYGSDEDTCKMTSNTFTSNDIDFGGSDSSDDEYQSQKRAKAPSSNTKIKSVSPAKKYDIPAEHDDDEFDAEDNKELFAGFTAPRVTGDDDAPTYKKPYSDSSLFAKGITITENNNYNTVKKSSKFGSKLAASVTSSQQFHNPAEQSNARVIIKPGQRIVVKARGRKSTAAAAAAHEAANEDY